mmetsp:Transcript_22593/g.43278  ORF Transcript_22593/g.43278 Transcript_22593/m.43278 type:complete len:608 (-) Transcript_22593:238-2061(-)
MVASGARRRGVGFGSGNRHSTRRSQRHVAPATLPSEAEVLRAVWSLYGDELRPYGRLLRKRLAEQPGPRGKQLHHCTDSQLRAVCEISPSLRVQHDESGEGVAGEWSALLVDQPPNFIDIYNEVDVYPEEVWAEAEVYFRMLGESGNYALPGGRYASAQALLKSGLPFLRGYSLGQVCHFTQVALSKRKLLGYADGAIVPYARSTSMLKSQCAQQQRPLVGPLALGNGGDAATGERTAEDGVLTVADWATARMKLREILESALLRGTAQVPLSNIKRLFRSLYQMELSETALGHSKISELLQDARFGDICTVRLQDRGYVVVPVQPQVNDYQRAATGARKLQNVGAPQHAMPQGMPPVKGTFIHYDLPPPTPSAPGALRRSSSLPGKDSLPKRTMSDSRLLEQHKIAAGLDPQERVRFCPDEPLGEEEEDSGNNSSRLKRASTWLPTPSPQYSAGRPAVSSLISWWEAAAKSPGGALRDKEGSGEGGSDGGSARSARVERQPSAEDLSNGGGSARVSARGERVRFCPGEPLVIDEGEESEEVTSGEAGQPKQPFPLMTPSPQYGSKWLSSAAHAALVNGNGKVIQSTTQHSAERLFAVLGCAPPMKA